MQLYNNRHPADLHALSLKMASLPIATTTILHRSNSSPSSSFVPRTPQVSINRKSPSRLHVSCNAGKDDDNQSSSSIGKFDRRNVLIGLGGLYGAASLANPFAFAAPINGPDIYKCGPADLPEGAEAVNCCPPTVAKIIDFELPPPPATLRVRPAAHLADKAYIEKFTRAIDLMKALPADDPRNFMQQANVHCAYCDAAYDQLGFPDLELQVHNSWLFMPFHRCYLYFFEKILGKLIDDPTFAMPFWNWDNPAGMKMPAFYTDRNSPLYDPLRDAKHQPPTIIDLDFNGTDSNISNEQQLSHNLTIMYRQTVSLGRTASTFLGSPYRAGDEPDPGMGSLENIPHGSVHVWTGDRTQPNIEDMGNFYSAARDPLFFGHHSNIDRIWSIWKTIGGRRRDFTDRDWLEASFLFYDENAQLVRIKVRDCLDSRNLGYVYQDVATPWLNSRPTPRRSRILSKAKKLVEAKAADAAPAPEDVFPATLEKAVRVMVRRPNRKRSKKQKEEIEEILVIEGIELDRDAFAKFDVLINDGHDEAEVTAQNTEFAGSFVNVPHRQHKQGKKIKTKLRLAITEVLEDLDCEDDEHLLVTLVPRRGSGAMKIGGVKIVLED
nr:polyphenol oxidase, chloroplastic-like [Ipomoea batatas]